MMMMVNCIPLRSGGKTDLTADAAVVRGLAAAVAAVAVVVGCCCRRADNNIVVLYYLQLSCKQ